MKVKKLSKILLVALVSVAVLLGGGYVGYRAYRAARQAHLVSQARDYLAHQEYKKALLCLQRAIRANRNDVAACRLMAELAERSRSPAALIWRNRVVELDPGSLDDRLALAKTALMLRDYATATNALDGVDSAGRKTSDYQNLAGTVAIATGQFAEAESCFTEAAKLDPQNSVAQLNLAIVRIHSTNVSVVADARSTLESLRTNPTNSVLRCRALRELTADAMRNQQNYKALTFCDKLVGETNSVFRDQLLRLEVLKNSDRTEFKSALAAAQNDATNTSASTYEMAMWQMARMSALDAKNWLRSLPMATQTNQPATLLIAECQVAQQDWLGLQTWVGAQHWADLEFLRHAFLARSLRGQQLDAAAKAEWDQALKAANSQEPSLVLLLRLATQFRWQTEGEEILWMIVNRYPAQQWAFRTLSQVLFVGGRTRPLMQLLSQRVQRFPSDLASKNNLAMTALLLDAKEMKPHELAREVYHAAPTNASYVSTYAFSLHVEQKDTDALKVFEKLPHRDLEDPSISGYYGLVLKATGDKAKALPYLDWAFKAPMLPEERKMFEQAKTGM